MSNISDLRQSTNETARVARANLLLFLAVGLFIAILVSATDDMLLLTRVHMDLPLMDVRVPIDHFYMAAPIIFVVLHLNLFLRLNRLAHVAGLLQEEVEGNGGPDKKTIQAALLYPFDFLQVLLYRTGRQATGEPPPFWQIFRYLKYEHEKYGHLMALVIIVALSVFVLPVVLLVLMQMRFLPYQSEFITFIHQGVISIDLAAQVFFIYRIGVFRKLLTAIRTGPAVLERLAGVANFITISSLLLVALGISWLIAVVPDSRLERNLPFATTRFAAMDLVFQDWWRDGNCSSMRRSPSRGTFRRYIHLPGKSITSEWRTAYVGTYPQGSSEEVEVWNLVDELDLSDRSLRYAWLERSRFQHTSFAESVLHCSNFTEATLQRAVFDGARLNETRFDKADLQGASFDGAILNETSFEEADLQRTVFDEAELNETRFDKADLREARFDDVRSSGSEFDRADMRDVELSGSKFWDGSFRRARMEGAVARSADFYGSDLSRTKLHGADMANVDFFGGSLSRAEFHGADLDGIDIHGTTLRRAEFYGTILEGADIRASNAGGARFFGTRLVRAEVTNTSLNGARFFGNDMRSIELQYSNLHNVRWEEPRNWASLTLQIGAALERRGLDAQEREEVLEDIKEDASEKYHSRGLDELLDDLERLKCTWTDASGPLEGLSEPDPVCWSELEAFLVNEACSSDDQGVAAGIAEVVGIPVTWQEAASALGLLETGTDECDAITEMHRSDICEGLVEWFGTDDEEGYSSESELERPIVWSSLMDRWNKAKDAELCSQMASE